MLLDEDGAAAEAIDIKTLGAGALVNPSAYGAVFRSMARGHRQQKSGRRPLQLGATVVMAPGDRLVYIDREDFAGDHADLDEVLDAIRSAVE